MMMADSFSAAVLVGYEPMTMSPSGAWMINSKALSRRIDDQLSPIAGEKKPTPIRNAVSG